ncbi:hybrid signal transduction histidine kinase M [Tanacetum coccineum]
MAVEDDNPPPPPVTTTTADKLIPFSISNKVPIKLDLEKHNYNSWSSFFLIHLGSLGLKPHVEEQVSSTNPEWSKLDDLIKMWILDARAINLDNELRSIKIGKMSINDYCTKIKSMAHRLKNLGCIVSKKNLVIYTVNGLDSRFATLVEIIRHRETLPTFETIRNMLLLKKSLFNDHADASTTFESSSSSPTILMASTPSDAKGLTPRTNNNRAIVTAPQGSWGFVTSQSTFGIHQARKAQQSDHHIPSPYQPTPVAFVTPTNSPSQAQKLSYQHPQPILSAQQPPTSLPSAFSTMTLQDPTWNMDTGDTSHLISNASNLSPVFNKRFFPSIHVGDVKNGTWVLVSRPLNVNLVRSMWLFKNKFHADGILSCYKARIVANGSSQQLSVDFDETFSPVVKSATIRMVLALLCYATRARFSHSRCDSSLFIYTQGSQIIDSLHKEFDMTDLEALNYFLGISAVRYSTGLFLSQKKYALYLLERAHMVYCNPSRMLIDTDTKLGPDGVPQICLYMHDPREPHFGALKRIMHYVKGMLDFVCFCYYIFVGYTDADWAGWPSTRRSTLDLEEESVLQPSTGENICPPPAPKPLQQSEVYEDELKRSSVPPTQLPWIEDFVAFASSGAWKHTGQ